MDNLLEAAIYGEKDELRGVTENVIVGQPIKLGTGAVELVMGSKYENRTTKRQGAKIGGTGDGKGKKRVN